MHKQVSIGPLLSVQGLYTWFELRRWGFGRAGVVRAVDGVSLTVEQGKVVVIIGPSGSGKSTVLRCINHLETPTGGVRRGHDRR